MNWDSILDGVVLSILGIATTFIALGLFILIMFVLRALFPNEEDKAARAAKKAAMSTKPSTTITADSEESGEIAAISAALMHWQGILQFPEEEQVAAAIAASLLHLRQQTTTVPVPQIESRLGANLERGRGRWWQNPDA